VNKRATILAVSLTIGIGVSALGINRLLAQGTGSAPCCLLKTRLSGIESKVALMGIAEIQPPSATGKHFHHGDEIGYVLNGSVIVDVEGEWPRALKAGDTYRVEANKVHDMKVTGTEPARVLAIYIVDKGKELAVSIQ
jgi:quercetin dioxygenase-like cupin family protein